MFCVNCDSGLSKRQFGSTALLLRPSICVRYLIGYTFGMPLPFFGPVAAGFPSPAQGYEDDPLDLHDLLIRHPAATFFYRIKGSELADEGIRDGSILIVDRSISPMPGCLVVADLDGERIVTAFGEKIEDQRLVVWGVVTAAVVRF